MGERIRKTGIDILGDVPWGTHFCQFYHTREDLIDILVPYFKAGLENNEFCMWITSEPFSEKEAKKAMRMAVPNFDRYLKRGQIEIVPYEEWYLKEGNFNLKRVLNAWIDKLDQALAQGYDGIRVTENTAWLEKRNWRNFTEYEKEINNTIGKYRMMAICTYLLDKCGASEVIDVVSNHQFTLIRQEGKWKLIESSERRQAEEALKESEEKFRNLAEQSPNMIFINKKGRVVYANKKCKEIMGYNMDEISSPDFDFFCLIAPESVKLVKSSFARHMKGKEVKPLEYTFITKDGKRIGTILSTKLIKYEAASAILGIVTDITERKQAEEALQKSERRFREFVELLPGMVFETDTKRIITFINTAVIDSLGYSKEDFEKGIKTSQLVIPEDRERHKTIFAKKISRKYNGATEYACLRKDGSSFPVIVHSNVINDDRGNVVGTRAIAVDIIERKRAEEEKDKLLRTIETTKEAINITTSDAIMKYTNDAMDELFGYKKGELIGKHASVLNAGPSRKAKKIPEYITDVIKKKGVWEGEIHNKRKDGTEFTSHAKIGALTDNKGEIINYVSTQHDITERKQEKEALQEKEEFNFALFQYNPIETIVIDLEGKVVKTNMAKRKAGDRLPNIGDVMYKDYAGKHEIDMHAELMECIRSGKKKKFPELKYGDKFLDITIAAFPKGAIITSQDITERKRMEEALRIKDKAIASSLNAIAIADLDGNLTYVNRSFLDLWGYKDEREALDRPSVSFWESEKKARNVARTSLTRGSWASELVAKRKDGSTFIAQLSANLVLDEYGKPICMMASLMDITDRKQAEEMLKESEEKFRQFFENEPAYCYMISPEGLIRDVNKSACMTLGYKKEELVGKDLKTIYAPEYLSKMRKYLANWKKTGKLRDKEIVIITKDGKRRNVLLSADVVKDKAGKILSSVSVQKDITERKRAEEEIKSSQSQLRNLTAHLQSVREEERTLIAREMHDELGQALTALKMDISWLDNRLPKDQRSLFEKTKVMSELADATLQTVKRISTELRPELLDDLGLPAAIEWQGEEFQNRTGIKCEVTIDPEDIILDKDRSTAIFRIFQETLTNVARHAKAKRVRVRLKEKAGKLELKVRDNGKGITEKQISDHKSFGLIGIKERTYYLGGKVVIKGLQDKGTTLTIRIPFPKKEKTR